MSCLDLIAGIVGKKPKTVEQYFRRRGWKTTNPEDVMRYLACTPDFIFTGVFAQEVERLKLTNYNAK